MKNSSVDPDVNLTFDFVHQKGRIITQKKAILQKKPKIRRKVIKAIAIFSFILRSKINYLGN